MALGCGRMPYGTALSSLRDRAAFSVSPVPASIAFAGDR